MILAAHQPQFAPWLGFFDKLERADVFVLLDNVQFKKNEWQNRNRIKGSRGPQWLTVPVSFRHGERIRDVAVDSRQNWARRHLATLRACYGRSKHFELVYAWCDELLGGRRWERLSDLNVALIDAVRHRLGISTTVLVASELGDETDDRDGRLIKLCRDLGADTYLAGAGGRSYMKVERFEEEGLGVQFQDYQHPLYPQLFGEFEPMLSVIDLLFNCGPDSLDVIRGRRGPCEETKHEHSGDRCPSR